VLNPSSAPDVRFTIRRTRRNGIDRLSLVGALDRDSVLVLEGELNAVARAGGALILDLRELTSIDRWGLHTIERVARRLDPCTSRIYIVNGDGPVSEALETAGMGDLLTGSDLSELLDAGDGTWSSTSLPPFPAQRVNTQLQVAEERP
jgi:anti-anti-sigma regulatory factor